MHYVAQETPSNLGEFPSERDGDARKRIFLGRGWRMKRPVRKGPVMSQRPSQRACDMHEGIGLSDRNRTCDPQLRRLLLYPTELRTVSENKKGPDGPLMLSALAGLKEWSERRDSNSRPSAPKADALPGCATLRRSRYSSPEISTSRPCAVINAARTGSPGCKVRSASA